MKKYRIIIMGMCLIYVILAGGMFLFMNKSQEIEGQKYRIEMNLMTSKVESERLYNDTKSMEDELGDMLSDSEYITDVTYISLDYTDMDTLEEYYTPNNGQHMEIVPIYEDEVLCGYLRYDYIVQLHSEKYIFIGEGILLCLFVVAIIILIYIYRNIVKPFVAMRKMPYELSKGNFTGEVKATKSKYLGQFIWGIGMLKDNLEYHKNKELQLAKDKKMILLSISHDIKTPINAINLYATGIMKGIYKNDNEIKAVAGHIKEKTTEIDGFVKDIVKSSTEDIIAIEINKKDFYLKDLVDKISAAYTEKCNINKTSFTIGKYENQILVGDIDRIYEAICNLMENAFKYGDGRRITITFSEEEYCQLIAVYNTGTPIDDKDMPHLFDSFYRGSNVEGKAGNGLGLYICHQIMIKSGGDIYAKRHEDGMEFVLVIE